MSEPPPVSLPAATATSFSAADYRRRFASAFQPQPWKYWADLLVSAGLGWGVFGLSLSVPFGSVVYLGCSAVAVLALLRAVLFIHELAHLKRRALPGFETAWLLLIGFPLMVPSIMYDTHGDHHRQASFGTPNDPEYLPLAHSHPLGLVWFVVQVSLVPVLLVVRWGVIGPLAACLPQLRRWVIRHASSLVINPRYCRALPSKRQRTRFAAQDATAGVMCWGVGLGCCLGWIPPAWLLQWWLTGAGILVINQIRTLAAHGYHNQGQAITTVEQVLDSITLRGCPSEKNNGDRSITSAFSLLTAAAAPVGLRYHALHHFLPTVPYHSLGLLHRRLEAELRQDSPYRQTYRNGIGSAISALIRYGSAQVTPDQQSENRRAAQ
ncbi:MAG: fatty acid desaturase [Desulfurellaceae bacterium]|nr:fatty acid desaturase [Desulfurellaceae bacterium]